MLITQTLRVMKLTAILLTFFAVHVMARTEAQTITYVGTNVPLKQVLTEIKKQTGYLAVYNTAQVEATKPVTVTAKDQPLTKFLTEILKGQNLEFSIENKTIVISSKEKKAPATTNSGINSGEILLPQIIDIRGTVKDDSGNPVVGASVQVKGSNKGTTTNNDGQFTLTGVDDKATLVISAVNIETREVEVNGRGEINLVAKVKVSKLEDVEITTVNTGYQVLPKERSTGAYSQVTSKLLSEQVSTDVLSRLESIVLGLNVNRTQSLGRPSIMIRGLSTIRGPKEPLIILDNFPYSGDLNNLNPNDVENITVLKDAAATSIWGARAGNGVIVITTKKGGYNKKMMVTLTHNINITDKPDLGYLRLMSAPQMLEVEKMLFSNGFRFSDTLLASRPGFSQAYEILFKMRSGLISPIAGNSALDSLSRYDLRSEYNKYIYRTSVNSQTNVSLQGGSANAAWRLSSGYDNNIGSLHETYRRANVSSSGEFRISKDLSISTQILYVNSYSKAGYQGFGEISTLRGELPVYTRFEDDQHRPLAETYNLRQSYIDTAGGGKLLDWNFYPLLEATGNNRISELQNVTGSVGLSYMPFRHFSLNINYQYENQSVQNKTLYNEESFTSRNLVNTYSQLDRQTGLVKYFVPRGAILDQSFKTLKVHNFRTQVGYNREWGNHALASIAGWEFRQANANETAMRTFGYNDNVLTSGNVDLTNQYPSFVTGSASFIPSSNNFTGTATNFLSSFTNLGYSYKSRYHFTASARRDASNLFGANANDKWNLLGSAGFGWDISKEKFYSISWMPSLKIRVTHGWSGNIDPSISAVTTLSYTSSLSPYTTQPYAIFDKFKNPELTWEQIATTNIGLDFRLFKSRITGTFDWYKKQGSNLYGTTPVDYTAIPTDRVIKNVAAIESSGFDAEINSINLNGKFQWTSQMHISINRDKVTKYYLDNNRGSNYINNGKNISAIAGLPVYAVFTYKWFGLDPNNGDPLGTFNGQISNNYTGITGATTTIDSLMYHGRALPAVFGSLGNSFRFKNFYLSFRMSFKFGYYAVKNTIKYSDLYNLNRTHSDYGLRWQKPGDEKQTNVPSAIYPASSRRDEFYEGAPVHVFRGDHIRFQYLTAGYEFNEEKVKGMPFRSCNIFVNVSNLGIIWRANQYKLDPDYSTGTIPPSASYAIGCKLTF